MNSLQQTLSAQLHDESLHCQAQQAAFDYLDALACRRVFPDEQALKALSVFEEDLPEQRGDAQHVIALLAKEGANATVAQNGGRYFGFVNGNALPVTLATKWLADVWDQNSALYLMSPISAKLEDVCQRWLNQLLGLPMHTVAGFVSGTSVATLSGLAAARYRQHQKLGWDINRQGMFAAPRLRLILGRQTHGTVAKAISLLGFGSDNIEWVDCDEQGRLLVACLPKLDEHCILVLQAGNENSGAFDYFSQICPLAKAAGAWVHIDGAFGLWAAASSHFAALTHGFEQADSWSVDAHKTLNTPYDCGIILCQDAQALTAALHQQGSYIQYSEEAVQKRDGMVFTPEMSRRARGTELWSALKFLGREGVCELVFQLHDHAQYLAQCLSKTDFTVLNDVVFNQVIICCENDLLTTQTLEFVQQSGEIWCGPSRWFDQAVIRLSICSWATERSDIDHAVSTLLDCKTRAVDALANR
ncbi:MAG: aspartate aminotransferase family protein [Paraglaciecola sp.]|nr:aspartate aminotransferase family protein [Paraglaciecola sp.]